jgi:hypothetical protein
VAASNEYLLSLFAFVVANAIRGSGNRWVDLNAMLEWAGEMGWGSVDGRGVTIHPVDAIVDYGICQSYQSHERDYRQDGHDWQLCRLLVERLEVHCALSVLGIELFIVSARTARANVPTVINVKFFESLFLFKVFRLIFVVGDFLVQFFLSFE